MGVNASESQSNMGPSTSYSFSNQRLFNFVLHVFRNKPAIIEADKKNKVKMKELWICLLCAHEYLVKQI